MAANFWPPDLRYGNNECARILSGIDGYMEIAEQGLEAMTKGSAKVIVRILVLPGHVHCCHKPALEILSKHQDRIWVSILDQYIPEHGGHWHGHLARRPTSEEISRVKNLMEQSHLQD